MPPRLRPDRIPLALAAIFVAVCMVITIWNQSVGVIFPRISIRAADQLFGIAPEPPPPLTLAAVLSGEAQNAFSRRIGTSLPMYPTAVRIKNQIAYSLFDVPAVASIAFGREKHLYEWVYVHEYCGRKGNVDASSVARWADKIKDIQDYAASHGKAFIYLLTPSKAAIYPEYLPDTLCPARLQETVSKLPPYDRALEERGVHYLDGSRLLAGAREREAIELFPRGGTHWNALGASLAAGQVVRILQQQQSRLDFGLVRTQWRETQEPQGTDRDLLNLLNLYWPDAHYPVPKMLPAASAADRSCRPTKIIEVGGSFLDQVNEALRASGCPPQISYWFYWDFLHIAYAGGERRSEPAREAERVADLAGSDVIVLEENEMNIGETEHLKALHALVASETHMATARGVSATH